MLYYIKKTKSAMLVFSIVGSLLFKVQWTVCDEEILVLLFCFHFAINILK